ncbi:hypothetical protein PHMEG_00014323, partial [Phytophthora megakarya]
SLSCWRNAVKCAAYILNRAPTNANSKRYASLVSVFTFTGVQLGAYILNRAPTNANSKR